MKNKLCCLTLLVFFFNYASAQKAIADREKIKEDITKNLQLKYQDYKTIALDIWQFAEVGFKEIKSSELLQHTLLDNGFKIDAGVAGMPTAFIASYGSGKPVIAILAEYDALPGLAQKAIPEKNIIEGASAGHGCGHHLFGTASVAAGIEIKKLIEQKKIAKLYGYMDARQKKVVQEKFIWYEMVYPGGRHGWQGNKQLHFQNLKTKFIYRHLLEKPVPKELLR